MTTVTEPPAMGAAEPFAPPAAEVRWVDAVAELAPALAARAAELDDRAELPLDNLRALHAAGVDTACLPSAHGGADLSFRAFGQIVSTIARACPSTACIWLMHIGAAHGLVTLGSPAAAAFYAAELAAGKRFANALSEPTSGNMFLVPLQSAAAAPGGHLLSGAKRFVSGSEVADHLLVNTLIDGTPTFYGVARDATMSLIPIWDTMGLRATRSQLVAFEGTLLREENRCTTPDPGQANRIATGLPFLSLGVADAAFDALADHARGRVIPSTGEPLAAMQWVKFDSADVHVRLHSARLLAQEAMWRADAGDPGWARTAVEAKLLANEVAKDVAALGVKVGGASGYLRTSPIQRHFRDAQAGALMAYSVEVCRDVIGGWVLDPA